MPNPSTFVSVAAAAAACVLLTGLNASTAWADHDPEPVGGEFQVNSYTTDNQLYPAVATAHDGSFVVVWMSLGSPGDDNDGLSIQGQRFNTEGTAVGAQFQVNSTTTGYQRYPVVDATDDGAFVVVWQSSDQDGDGSGIFAQRFDALGGPVGGEFAVNTTTAGDQLAPSIAVDNEGAFVVAWQDSSLDGDGSGIAAQRFLSGGLPSGSEFQVNAFTTGEQSFPAVALNDDGTFVVAWQSGDTIDDDVRAAFGLFDDIGIDADCEVNDVTFGDQGRPSVGIDGEGQAIVAWQDLRGDNGYQIMLRTLSAMPGSACVPGTESTASATTGNDHTLPTVSRSADGQFVIVWTESGVFQVRGRHYRDGVAGPGFVANTSPLANLRPWVDFDEGGFVVTWTEGLTADEVLAQRYRGDKFFGDGFESGDTARWSDAVP